jgi:hypothetical protein
VALVGPDHRGKRFRANPGIIITGKLAAAIYLNTHVRILEIRLPDESSEVERSDANYQGGSILTG